MLDKNCAYCCNLLSQINPTLNVLYQDDSVTAFLNPAPSTKGHSIVITNEHVPSVSALTESLSGHMFFIASRIAVSCFRTLDANGYNIIACDGFCAAQDVAHASFHVIPRYLNDGYALNWSTINKGESLANIAEKIKGRLRGCHKIT